MDDDNEVDSAEAKVNVVPSGKIDEQSDTDCSTASHRDEQTGVAPIATNKLVLTPALTLLSAAVNVDSKHSLDGGWHAPLVAAVNIRKTA